jgi:ketosteroid isomerase-like protein
MTTSDNLAVVKQFVQALAACEKDKMVALIADDFIWQVPAPSLGAEPQSGLGVPEILVATLSAIFEPGALNLGVVRSAVDGDTVVLEVNGTAITKTGVHYDNWYVLWFELDNGKIKLFREHVDTKYVMDTLLAE